MAVRLTPSDRLDERLERSLEAANHSVAAGDTPHARVLLEGAVNEAPPGVQRARALRGLAEVQMAQNWTTAIALFHRALGEAGEDRGLRGTIELGLGYGGLFTGDLAAAEVHARSALELAEEADDPAAVAEALQFVAYVEFARGRGLRMDLLDRAIALEQQTDDHWVWDELRPSCTRAQLLRHVDRFDEARSVFQALLDRAQQRGREHPLPALHGHLAQLECWAGNLTAAQDHSERSLEGAIQTGMAAYVASALFAKALVDAHLGRVHDAHAAATEGLALGENVGSVMSQILNLSVIGFLELFQGHPAGAHRFLGRAAVLTAEMGVEEPALFRFVPDEVEALIALGELESAAALLDPFEERAARLDRAWALACGARCRGLLLTAAGDVPGALDALDGALRCHELVPEPFALARTLVALGRVQRRAKLKGKARESFDRALEIYSQMGAGPWAERVGRESSRIGGHRPGPFELTPTEERVAALVMEGQTNREVATALSLSVNTIEWNLSRIYRKVGVRSRTELAAKLRSVE
jgi:DNA-binding CsgD family transcriptional regulator